MEQVIGVLWCGMCVVISIVAVIWLCLYISEVKWYRREYLWEYIDKKFNVVLEEKERKDEVN